MQLLGYQLDASGFHCLGASKASLPSWARCFSTSSTSSYTSFHSPSILFQVSTWRVSRCFLMSRSSTKPFQGCPRKVVTSRANLKGRYLESSRAVRRICPNVTGLYP